MSNKTTDLSRRLYEVVAPSRRTRPDVGATLRQETWITLVVLAAWAGGLTYASVGSWSGAIHASTVWESGFWWVCVGLSTVGALFFIGLVLAVVLSGALRKTAGKGSDADEIESSER